MKLTQDIIETLLSSKRILNFWKTLAKYDLNEEDWKPNKKLLSHYQKLHEEMEKNASRLSDPIMTEAVERKK